MPAQITILAGPPQSGKTERLLARYRAALAQDTPGAGLWLAPTWRAAAEVRGRLVGRPFQADTDGLERPSYAIGYFAPGVATFAKFAASVLEHLPEPIRPIGRLMKRQLVRRLIDEHARQGRLRHFRPIAGTTGLVDLVCEFISELKRLEIWPEHFRQACRERGSTDKDQELFELYEAYQQSLREANLYDAEGLLWTARDWLDKSLASKRPPPGMKRFWERLRLVVADGFTDFTRTQHEILEILAKRA